MATTVVAAYPPLRVLPREPLLGQGSAVEVTWCGGPVPWSQRFGLLRQLNLTTDELATAGIAAPSLRSCVSGEGSTAFQLQVTRGRMVVGTETSGIGSRGPINPDCDLFSADADDVGARSYTVKCTDARPQTLLLRVGNGRDDSLPQPVFVTTRVPVLCYPRVASSPPSMALGVGSQRSVTIQGDHPLQPNVTYYTGAASGLPGKHGLALRGPPFVDASAPQRTRRSRPLIARAALRAARSDALCSTCKKRAFASRRHAHLVDHHSLFRSQRGAGGHRHRRRQGLPHRRRLHRAQRAVRSAGLAPLPLALLGEAPRRPARRTLRTPGRRTARRCVSLCDADRCRQVIEVVVRFEDFRIIIPSRKIIQGHEVCAGRRCPIARSHGCADLCSPGGHERRGAWRRVLQSRARAVGGRLVRRRRAATAFRPAAGRARQRVPAPRTLRVHERQRAGRRIARGSAAQQQPRGLQRAPRRPAPGQGGADSAHLGHGPHRSRLAAPRLVRAARARRGRAMPRVGPCAACLTQGVLRWSTRWSCAAQRSCSFHPSPLGAWRPQWSACAASARLDAPGFTRRRCSQDGSGVRLEYLAMPVPPATESPVTVDDRGVVRSSGALGDAIIFVRAYAAKDEPVPALGHRSRAHSALLP
jgi:hypothetical protein